MNEIDALKAIDDTLTALDDETRARVLQWAASKYLQPGSFAAAPIPGQGQRVPSKKGTRSDSNPRGSSSKKIKVVIKQVKDLDLAPKGKQSALTFVAAKSPSNVKEKAVVAVYYLLNILELSSATVDQVYTFFKQVGWEVPSDLKNTLQQAGTAGWLDTAVATDLKVTSSGENLIEHRLPKNKNGE